MKPALILAAVCIGPIFACLCWRAALATRRGQTLRAAVWSVAAFAWAAQVVFALGFILAVQPWKAG